MNAEAPTIVLIHGMWLTPRGWDDWIDHYRDRGYKAIAPGWPGVKDPDETRRDPSPLKGLGLTHIVDHYEQVIRGLEQPPIVIGHSFGGLTAQLLLNRGLGVAGVAIGTAPPKGILVLPFSTLKAGSPALAHPSKWHGVVTLTLEEFTYGFVNTFPPEAAAAAYERYAVPETGQIFYEAGFANFRLHPPTEVHFKNEQRAPLLIVGATEDKTVPASVSKKQYEKYEKADVQTDYLEFEGRPHLMMVAEGWEEIAAAIESWIAAVPERSAASGP
jgi:pimeloyl-ACP methyl ester carboxylesterase